MEAKHELTEASSASIHIPNIIHDESGTPYHVEMEVTREQFNEVIRDLVMDTREAVQKALMPLNLRFEMLIASFWSAALTKVPLVKEMLQEMFGREPYSDIDPDTAIARGAAILGATMNLPQDADFVPKEVDDIPAFKIELHDKVTHNLGIEVVGGRFSCLIRKGIDIPADQPVVATKDYSTPAII